MRRFRAALVPCVLFVPYVPLKRRDEKDIRDVKDESGAEAPHSKKRFAFTEKLCAPCVAMLIESTIAIFP